METKSEYAKQLKLKPLSDEAIKRYEGIAGLAVVEKIESSLMTDGIDRFVGGTRGLSRARQPCSCGSGKFADVCNCHNRPKLTVPRSITPHDPCYCGSGKRYGKCHYKKGEQ